jgi:hypothetical protein
MSNRENPTTHTLSVDPANSQSLSVDTDSMSSPSRRSFLKAAGIGAAAFAASTMVPGLVPTAEAVEIGPPEDDPTLRGNTLQQIRNNAAATARTNVINAFPHPTNGDEEHYSNQAFAGNFSKTLPHDPATGLVDPAAYQDLLNALEVGTVAAFDTVPAGGAGRFAGPVSPLVFQIEGADSVVAASPFVPPSISSGGGAAEMVELYWEAFLRDVPFIQYGTNSLIGQAVMDMNKLSGYGGAGGPGGVTPQNLFRYPFFGATDGPYVSQLLYQTHFFDGTKFVPQIRVHAQVADPNTGDVLMDSPGVDFMTNLPEYVQVENGQGAISDNVFDNTPRFIRDVRGLGSLANSDSIFSIYFRAAIILAGLGIGVSNRNPYTSTTRITGFSTFSTAWLFGLLGAVHKTEAHAFYQKWYVHRKLRPEAFGNLVDGVMNNRFTLTPALHPDLTGSAVLPMIKNRNLQLNQKRGLTTADSWQCPQMLNGGSPSHPSSPAGHAFTAGACVTLLKAVFEIGTPAAPVAWPLTTPDGTPNPVVQSSADGLSLVTTGDTNLTVLGELNKLAANISEGRDMLGIHWRVSDNMHGMFEGEDVAIALLNEAAATYPESFPGFILTKFDGTTITIGGNA